MLSSRQDSQLSRHSGPVPLAAVVATTDQGNQSPSPTPRRLCQSCFLRSFPSFPDYNISGTISLYGFVSSHCTNGDDHCLTVPENHCTVSLYYSSMYYLTVIPIPYSFILVIHSPAKHQRHHRRKQAPRMCEPK